MKSCRRVRNEMRTSAFFSVIILLRAASHSSAEPNFFKDLLDKILPKPPAPTFVKCETDEDCLAVDVSSVCSDTAKICIGCKNADAMCSIYHYGVRCTQRLTCVKNPSQRCVFWSCKCDDGTTLDPDQYCAPFYLNGSLPDVNHTIASEEPFPESFTATDLRTSSALTSQEEFEVKTTSVPVGTNFEGTLELTGQSFTTDAGFQDAAQGDTTDELFPGVETMNNSTIHEQPTYATHASPASPAVEDTLKSSDGFGTTGYTSALPEQTSSSDTLASLKVASTNTVHIDEAFKPDNDIVQESEAQSTSSGVTPSSPETLLKATSVILPEGAIAQFGTTNMPRTMHMAADASTASYSTLTAFQGPSLSPDEENGSSFTPSSSQKDIWGESEGPTRAANASIVNSAASSSTISHQDITTTSPVSALGSQDVVVLSSVFTVDSKRDQPTSEFSVSVTTTSGVVSRPSVNSISSTAASGEMESNTVQDGFLPTRETESTNSSFEITPNGGPEVKPDAFLTSSALMTDGPMLSTVGDSARMAPSNAADSFLGPINATFNLESTTVLADISSEETSSGGSTGEATAASILSTTNMLSSEKGYDREDGMAVSGTPVSTTFISPDGSEDDTSPPGIVHSSLTKSFLKETSLNNGSTLPSEVSTAPPLGSNQSITLVFTKESTQSHLSGTAEPQNNTGTISGQLPMQVNMTTEPNMEATISDSGEDPSRSKTKDVTSLRVENGSTVAAEATDGLSPSPTSHGDEMSASKAMTNEAYHEMDPTNNPTEDSASQTSLTSPGNPSRISNEELGSFAASSATPALDSYTMQPTETSTASPATVNNGPLVPSKVTTSVDREVSYIHRETLTSVIFPLGFSTNSITTDERRLVMVTQPAPTTSPNSRSPRTIVEIEDQERLGGDLGGSSTMPQTDSNAAKNEDSEKSSSSTKHFTKNADVPLDERLLTTTDEQAFSPDTFEDIARATQSSEAAGDSNEQQSTGKGRKNKSLDFPVASQTPLPSHDGNETNSTELITGYGITRNFKGFGFGNSGLMSDISKRVTISRVLTSISILGLFAIIALLSWKAYFFKKRVDAHLERTEESDDETLFEVDLGYRNRYQPTNPQPDDRIVKMTREHADVEAGSVETSSSELSNQSLEIFGQTNTVPAKVHIVNLAGRSIELEPANNRGRLFKRQVPGEVTLLDASYGSGQLLMKPLIPLKERLRKQSNTSVQDYCQVSDPASARCLRINVAPNNKLTGEKLPPIDGEFSDRELAMMGRKGSPAAAAHAAGIGNGTTWKSEYEDEEDVPVTQKLRKLKPGYRPFKASPKHLAPLKVRKYKYPSNSESNGTLTSADSSSPGDNEASRPDFESTMYSPMFPPFWRQLLASDDEALPLVADVIRTHEDAIRRRKQGDDKKPPLLFGIGF